MELTQTRNIAAPSAAVWAALNDPVVLKACIPGCESLDRVSDSEWMSVVATRIGPVQARFKGRVTLADVEPPSAYTLKFDGQGGAAGFASGEARVSLASAGDAATVLTYTANARVGGKIAQLGSRLVDGAAAKLADDFFTRFAAYLAPAPAVSAPGARALDAAPPADASDALEAPATSPGVRAAGDGNGGNAQSTPEPVPATTPFPPRRGVVRYAALLGIVVVLALLYVYRQH